MTDHVSRPDQKNRAGANGADGRTGLNLLFTEMKGLSTLLPGKTAATQTAATQTAAALASEEEDRREAMFDNMPV